jgi:beta-galactosidase
LRRLIDIKVRRVESLRPGIKVPVAGSNAGAAFDGWREFLVAGPGVESLLTSTDAEPMLVRQGRVHYLAGRPDSALNEDVVRRLLDEAGVAALNLPDDVRIRDNGTMRYVFNYGTEAADISAVVAGAGLLLGDSVLPPCGVAAFRTSGRA